MFTGNSKMKPTKKEYQELKEYKKRVWLEAYNAIQLMENNQRKNLPFSQWKPYVVKIGNSTFTFNPAISINRKEVDKMMSKFTITKW